MLISPENKQKIITLLKNGWCKKTYSKNILGQSCYYWDAGAISFCMMGAINKVIFHEDSSEKIKFPIMDRIRELTSQNPIPFNDSCNSVEEVIKVVEQI